MAFITGLFLGVVVFYGTSLFLLCFRMGQTIKRTIALPGGAVAAGMGAGYGHGGWVIAASILGAICGHILMSIIYYQKSV